MNNMLHMSIKKIIKTLLPVTVIMLVLGAPFSASLAEGADLQIEQKEPAYIGCEVTLSLAGSAAQTQNASYEWVFEGNMKPILIRNGGLECRFTPVDTEPIKAQVSVFDAAGNLSASSEITLKASEFTVDIVMIEPEPFILWDAAAKQDAPAEGLIAGEPVQFEVKLTPAYDRPITCDWNTDASTAIRSGGSEQKVTIVRNDIGDAELSIVVSDASGVVLGRGSRNVNVPIPRTRIDESVRRRKAWNQWLTAQSQWDAKNFDEAVANAEEASTTDPETIEITDGFAAMNANYTRVQRSRELTASAIALHGEQNLTDALKTYRRAYAAWPLSETETSIRTLESEIDKIRIRRQQAEWTKDTAAAYDQEGFFADALKYYKATLELLPDDAVSQRAERIELRLASMAQAEALSGEGRELESRGQLLEAVEKYEASLEFEPDTELETHTAELEETIRERRTRATALRREAADLQRRDSDAEALTRYRESQNLWPDPEVETLIAELEQTVTETPQPVRTPEDFGIGTQADATRLLQEGHALYKEAKYREALDAYRKSFAISNDERLADWISRVETSLQEYESVLQANLLIKEANNLYNDGNQAGALEKYRESLSIHPNAEVENFMKMLAEVLSVDITSGDAAAGEPASQ